MKLLDDNGREVKHKDWVKSSQNDYIPTEIEKDTHDGELYINTFHAEIMLKDARPFTKCEPCRAETCCNYFGDVKCTYNENVKNL